MSSSKSSARARRAEAPPTTPATIPHVGRTDFDRYLGTPDAQLAEWWQLQALCGLRRGLFERRLSQRAYERIRAVLAEEETVRRFGSTANAHAWLAAEGFEYEPAGSSWVHADGRTAAIERSPTSKTRYVRITWEP